MSEPDLQEDARLRADPLFLGMTRPALAWGVPFGAVVGNAMVTTIVFLATADLRLLGLFLPVHVLAYLVCLRDPRIFELLRVRATKTPPLANARFWRCQSYMP